MDPNLESLKSDFSLVSFNNWQDVHQHLLGRVLTSSVQFYRAAKNLAHSTRISALAAKTNDEDAFWQSFDQIISQSEQSGILANGLDVFRWAYFGAQAMILEEQRGVAAAQFPTGKKISERCADAIYEVGFAIDQVFAVAGGLDLQFANAAWIKKLDAAASEMHKRRIEKTRNIDSRQYDQQNQANNLRLYREVTEVFLEINKLRKAAETKKQYFPTNATIFEVVLIALPNLADEPKSSIMQIAENPQAALLQYPERTVATEGNVMRGKEEKPRYDA